MGAFVQGVASTQHYRSWHIREFLAVSLEAAGPHRSLQDADIRCTDHECRILVPATADAGWCNIVSRARETIPGEQRSRSRRDHCESCDGEGRKSKTLVKNGEASPLCRKILGCIVLARLNHRTRSIFPLRGTTLIGADMTGALQQSGLRSRTCEFTRLSTCSQKDLCLWGNIEISKTSLDGAFRRRPDLKGWTSVVFLRERPGSRFQKK